MRIYVGNLAYEVTEDDLQKHFEPFGKVQSVSVIHDKQTGRSKGFGFVEMESNTEGQAAIDNLNEKELQGRKLTVNEARPRTEGMGDRGGGGGRFYGGGGGGDRGGFGKRSGGGGGGRGGGGRGGRF